MHVDVVNTRAGGTAEEVRRNATQVGWWRFLLLLLSSPCPNQLRHNRSAACRLFRLFDRASEEGRKDRVSWLHESMDTEPQSNKLSSFVRLCRIRCPIVQPTNQSRQCRFAWIARAACHKGQSVGTPSLAINRSVVCFPPAPKLLLFFPSTDCGNCIVRYTTHGY